VPRVLMLVFGAGAAWPGWRTERLCITFVTEPSIGRRRRAVIFVVVVVGRRGVRSEGPFLASL